MSNDRSVSAYFNGKCHVVLKISCHTNNKSAPSAMEAGWIAFRVFLFLFEAVDRYLGEAMYFDVEEDCAMGFCRRRIWRGEFWRGEFSLSCIRKGMSFSVSAVSISSSSSSCSSSLGSLELAAWAWL